MQISDEKIEEYRKIYKEEFGKEISKEEARRQGTNLVNLMKLIYKPITKEEAAKFGLKDQGKS